MILIALVEVVSVQDMYDKLRKFATNSDHRKHDSSVVVILSHGEEGMIYGTDDRLVAIDQILNLFSNSNAKELKGKPKLFIVQACRGSELFYSFCSAYFQVLTKKTFRPDLCGQLAKTLTSKFFKNYTTE